MAKYKKKYGARRNYYRKRAAKRTLYDIGNLEENAPARQARRVLYGPSRRQRAAGMGTASRDQMIMRRGMNYYGDGTYWGDIGKNVGHWGSRIAGAGLNALSAMPGGALAMGEAGLKGWKSGAEFSKAQGWGSYNVGSVTNDLISGKAGNGSAPVYHSAGAIDESGDVVLSNRELVKVIKASDVAGEFKVEKFKMNPSDDTFYHLRKTAEQYEQFEYLGLMFQYVPMTGEGGSNALGTIGQACNYDPENDRDFTSMEDLMRFKGSTTHKPSVGSTFGIECDPSKRAVKTMYVRDEIDRDRAFTDPAQFMFASDGIATAGQVLGQLWVTYSIRLRNIKPYESDERGIQRVSLSTNSTGFVLDENKYTELFKLTHPPEQPSTASRYIKLQLKKEASTRSSYEVNGFVSLDSAITSSDDAGMAVNVVSQGRLVPFNCEGKSNGGVDNAVLNGVVIKGSFLSATDRSGDLKFMFKFVLSFENDADTSDGVIIYNHMFRHAGKVNIHIRKINYIDPSVSTDLYGT